MGGGSDDRAAARRALAQCARQGRRLTIQSARRKGSSKDMSAIIEQVRENDFIIDLPMVGTHTRLLAVNEPLLISFMSDAGRGSGRTKALSRYRFTSGGEDSKRVLYGYRLAIPDELEMSNRRRSYRVSLEHGSPVRVTLHPPGVSTPLKAVILDVSAGGMRLRLDKDALLIDGQELLLTAELPPPCGSVAEPVRIMRVMQCLRTNQPVIGVSFPDEVVSIAQYVRQLELQRSHRTGAA